MIYFGVDINSTGVNTLIIVIAAVTVGFFTLIRGRSDVWKSNYEAEKSRGDDLQREVASLKVRVAELEAQPNIDKLFKVMNEVSKQNLQITKQLSAITKKL